MSFHHDLPPSVPGPNIGNQPPSTQGELAAAPIPTTLLPTSSPANETAGGKMMPSVSEEDTVPAQFIEHPHRSSPSPHDVARMILSAEQFTSAEDAAGKAMPDRPDISQESQHGNERHEFVIPVNEAPDEVPQAAGGDDIRNPPIDLPKTTGASGHDRPEDNPGEAARTRGQVEPLVTKEKPEAISPPAKAGSGDPPELPITTPRTPGASEPDPDPSSPKPGEYEGPVDAKSVQVPHGQGVGDQPSSQQIDVSEADPNDPNDFTSIDVWYDDEPLPVMPEERAVLAASAAEFGPFSSEVYRLSEVHERYKANDESQPEDATPLGDDMGLDATAYDTVVDGKHCVVRFAKGPDTDENTEMTKLRLLTLARTELREAPHLERLVTYDLPENAVVTKWAEGTPADELSPDDIADIPSAVLVSLQETATKMEQAKVALDIIWGAEGEGSEDALKAVVSHYDTQAGPTYFDLTNIEADQGRPNEAGRHYAELVTTMVATGYSLDATAGHSYQPLTLQAVVARVELFDKAYRRVQATWPDSSGAGWLARTAGRMIQTLPVHEQDLVMADADRVAIPLDYRDEY